MMKDRDIQNPEYKAALSPVQTTLVIPCIDPGLSCCGFQLTALNKPAKNVRRCEVYCMSWRLNHPKDGVIYHCNPDNVAPVIDAEKLQRMSGYKGP
jgi:hypothetical protein